MTYYDKLRRQIAARILGLFTLTTVTLAGLGWFLDSVLKLSALYLWPLMILLALAASVMFAGYIGRLVTDPINIINQAILHVGPNTEKAEAPNLDKTKIGHELVSSLVLQIYQLASSVNQKALPKTEEANVSPDSVVRNLPLALIGLDKNGRISLINERAREYFNLSGKEVIGKDLNSAVSMSFGNENTFDKWLNSVRGKKITDRITFDRVRGDTPDRKQVQFDLSASYSQNDTSGVETMLTFMDRTQKYGQEDEAFSYVALAVHELRTPITMLRGYIEVFQDELANKLTPELKNFMEKMQASAEMLSNFVNNILNVAKIEGNQLILRLDEAVWADVLRSALVEARVRANVHQKFIDLHVEPGLKTVAVDKLSIYEVLNNLIDNAIKYSGDGPKKIVVKAYKNGDGFIETTVQDFGVGIPAPLLENLFEKFYRSHRSRTQIGGTGLGLFLCKAIVEAHGGHIWVRSTEGEGTTFGFTLQPYSMVARTVAGPGGITREAFGWIKNHSMFRR